LHILYYDDEHQPFSETSLQMMLATVRGEIYVSA